MELKDNKIIIEINDTPVEKTPAEKTQPENRSTDTVNEVSQLLRQGASLPNGLPVIGEYSSKLTNVYNRISSIVGEGGTLSKIATGGASGALAGAGLAIAALSVAHNIASTYVKNMRQSAELQRRAGIRRGQ